jgi:hypothetical protein
MTSNDSTRGGRRTAGALDIRLFIALLIGIYGVVLTGFGIGASDADIDKAAGLNLNLWSGLGMVALALGFALWTKLRPIIIPEEPDEEDPSRERAPHA